MMLFRQLCKYGRESQENYKQIEKGQHARCVLPFTIVDPTYFCYSFRTR